MSQLVRREVTGRRFCFQAYGVHLSEWLAYDIYRLDGREPGAEPVFRCPCTCNMCSHGRCVEEYGMHSMLREQREGFALRHNGA